MCIRDRYSFVFFYNGVFSFLWCQVRIFVFQFLRSDKCTNVDKAETDYDLVNLLNNTAAGNLAQAMKEVVPARKPGCIRMATCGYARSPKRTG